MTIERLEGTSTRLYSLVAPLVMKSSVLRQNNNYPFKTSRRHTWFVAIEGCDVLGFMPVEVKDKNVTINNYYVAGDNAQLLTALLKEVIQTYERGHIIQSVTHTRHLETFKERGFSVTRACKVYVKMLYKKP